MTKSLWWPYEDMPTEAILNGMRETNKSLFERVVAGTPNWVAQGIVHIEWLENENQRLRNRLVELVDALTVAEDKIRELGGKP